MTGTKRGTPRNNLKAPLTDEERVFIADHLQLVSAFLAHRGLPFDEWYDVIIFRYMLACRNWLSRPYLHQWQFSTVAFHAMSSAVHDERAKADRRIKTISLETVVCEGGKDMTLADILTSEMVIQKF